MKRSSNISKWSAQKYDRIPLEYRLFSAYPSNRETVVPDSAVASPGFRSINAGAFPLAQ